MLEFNLEFCACQCMTRLWKSSFSSLFASLIHLTWIPSPKTSSYILPRFRRQELCTILKFGKKRVLFHSLPIEGEWNLSLCKNILWSTVYFWWPKQEIQWNTQVRHLKCLFFYSQTVRMVYCAWVSFYCFIINNKCFLKRKGCCKFK